MPWKSRLNINRLSRILPFSSYDRTRFAAVTIRLLQPSSTVLLFCSGKLVVTGAASCEDALLSAYHIVDILKETHPGQNFFLVSYEIQNIVSSLEIPIGKNQVLDIQAFYRDHAAECTFQRSMFPGLVYRSKIAKPIVLLCFSSARIVITGAGSLDNISKTWAMLWPTIRRYIVWLAKKKVNLTRLKKNLFKWGDIKLWS